MMPLAVEEHIGLVLIATAGDSGKCRQAGGRNCPQPSLGVPQGDPTQAVQKESHGSVSALALDRYLGTGEVTTA